jgi:hypothetical protein
MTTWAGYVVHMGGKNKCVHNFYPKISKEKMLGDLNIDRRIILK